MGIWAFCPILLGRFISRSGEDSVNRLLKVLILRIRPFGNLKFSGSPVLLFYYDLGNVLSCCFSPFLGLHCYN